VLWIFFACNILGGKSTWFLIPETRRRDADVVDFEEWKEASVSEDKERSSDVRLV
jgi:PHS family inorganic phosphate transporter-like MFS transporter